MPGPGPGTLIPWACLILLWGRYYYHPICRLGKWRLRWKYPECAPSKPKPLAPLLLPPPLCSLFHTAVRGSLIKPRSDHVTPLCSKLFHDSHLIQGKSQTLHQRLQGPVWGPWPLALLPVSPMHALLQARDLPGALLTDSASGPWPLQASPPLGLDGPHSGKTLSDHCT